MERQLQYLPYVGLKPMPHVLLQCCQAMAFPLIMNIILVSSGILSCEYGLKSAIPLECIYRSGEIFLALKDTIVD